MLARIHIAVVALAAVCLTGAVSTAAGDNWKPVAQPDLAAAFEKAPDLKFQDLADGPDTCWKGPEWWVPNPDGKTWDLVMFNYPGYTGPHEVHIYDFGTKQMKRTTFHEVDKVRFMFHGHECFLINGRLLVSCGSNRPAIYTYDPAKNLLAFGGFPVGKAAGGNGHIAPNDDGTMFYGSAAAADSRTAGNKVVFYKFDSTTLKGEILGTVGSEHPRMIWEYNKTEADGDWVYAAVGNTPWKLYGMNVKTREGKVIAETEPIVGDAKTITIQRSSAYPGCMVSITGLKGTPKDRASLFWLRNGELTPREPTDRRATPVPPWAGEKFAAARQSFSMRYAKAPAGLDLIRMPVDMDGKVRCWFRASGEHATTLGVDPKTWQKFEYDVKLYPAGIRRMAVLPDNSLFAVTEGYGRAIRFNPRTGERIALGPTMSVYSLAMHQDKLYLCGYPSSQVWIYDPAQPWTVGRSTDAPPDEQGDEEDVKAGADSNPANVAMLKDFTKVHMPFGGAVPGADGRVYFGGKIIRIGNGGGLGWWDIAEKKAGGIFEPFSAYQIFWMCSADNGRYILCSTKPVVDDLNPNNKPERGGLFVYDTTTREVIHKVESEVWNTPGYIAETQPGLVIGYTTSKDGPILYGFDAPTGKVLWTKPVPKGPQTSFAAIRRWNYAFTKGPDGFIWATMDGVLVRIDPANAQVHVVGKMPDAQIAFLDGDVYVGGSSKYRKIVGIPKVK